MEQALQDGMACASQMLPGAIFSLPSVIRKEQSRNTVGSKAGSKRVRKEACISFPWHLRSTSVFVVRFVRLFSTPKYAGQHTPTVRPSLPDISLEDSYFSPEGPVSSEGTRTVIMAQINHIANYWVRPGKFRNTIKSNTCPEHLEKKTCITFTW